MNRYFAGSASPALLLTMAWRAVRGRAAAGQEEQAVEKPAA